MRRLAINSMPDQPTSPRSWTELRERLRRFAQALSRDPHQAEDLTQETFAAVLTHRPDRIEHVGYLRQTLVRRWLDGERSIRRRLARLKRLALHAPWWYVEPDRFTAEERLQRATWAVEGLPPLQRLVLVLRLVEELPYEEIAAMLETSTDNVRSNLHLARKRVREVVGGDE